MDTIPDLPSQDQTLHDCTQGKSQEFSANIHEVKLIAADNHITLMA